MKRRSSATSARVRSRSGAGIEKAPAVAGPPPRPPHQDVSGLFNGPSKPGVYTSSERRKAALVDVFGTDSRKAGAARAHSASGSPMRAPLAHARAHVPDGVGWRQGFGFGSGITKGAQSPASRCHTSHEPLQGRGTRMASRDRDMPIQSKG